jgi:hypothetical protein
MEKLSKKGIKSRGWPQWKDCIANDRAYKYAENL